MKHNSVEAMLFGQCVDCLSITEWAPKHRRERDAPIGYGGLPFPLLLVDQPVNDSTHGAQSFHSGKLLDALGLMVERFEREVVVKELVGSHTDFRFKIRGVFRVHAGTIVPARRAERFRHLPNLTGLPTTRNCDATGSESHFRMTEIVCHGCPFIFQSMAATKAPMITINTQRITPAFPS